MELFDHRNNYLCNIVLSKEWGIFLENNLTPNNLIVYDGFVGIYEQKYRQFR